MRELRGAKLIKATRALLFSGEVFAGGARSALGRVDGLDIRGACCAACSAKAGCARSSRSGSGASLARLVPSFGAETGDIAGDLLTRIEEAVHLGAVRLDAPASD